MISHTKNTQSQKRFFVEVTAHVCYTHLQSNVTDINVIY